MKIENHKKVFSSAVRAHETVTFSVNILEATELRKALAIIKKYENAAVHLINEKHKINVANSSDWCSFSHRVQNDRFIVSVKYGSIG